MRLGRARRPLLSTAGSLLILAGLLPAAAAIPVLAVSPDVVISEVYGGGGNSGATYTNDYIELYNRGATAVDLTGWSVQYGSSGGTTWNSRTNLSGSIPAGKYYLIQEAAGAGGTTPLPMPNAVGTIAMSASAGKIALVNSTVALTGSGCPFGPTVVDFVGYGAANCSETAPAPGLSNTTAAIRAADGATDTDNNSADFSAGTPDPDTSADAAPTVTATTPANGASSVAAGTNVTVTFSEAVTVSGAWFSIQCTSTGAHAATVSGGPTTFTLDPTVDFGSSESCTVTVVAAQVSDNDGIDPPDTMAADATATFAMVDACTLPFTPTYAIQGSGATAAQTGQRTTQGVVVGDFEGSAGLQGFFLQDLTGDGDAATSDGIFVFTGTANTVDVGDVVRVTGYARERFDQTALNGSNSSSSPVPAAGILDCGTGSVAATDVELPFSRIGFPERYEGMLVRLPQPLVIAEYFNYERFGELVLALPLGSESRPFTPTSIVEPGAPAQARALANSLSRITLDDGSTIQNPPSVRHPNGDPFALDNRFRGGDTVRNAIGVMGQDFGLYRIQPTAAAAYTAVNERPVTPPAVGGTLRAAAMNTLNYFLTLDYPTGNPLDNTCGPSQTLECRGADFAEPAEFTRQRDKLIAALVGLDADVIGLNEIENTPGVDPLADPTRGIVAGLNEIFGAGTYAAINTGTIGTDAIKVGLIYKPAKVTPVGAHAVLTSAVDPRFVDTKSRPALAQTFEEVGTGARFTVAVNHLKSKGSDCLDLGDADAGDGQGNCNRTRTLAAQALVDWLATDPTGSGDRDVLILGDLNSYAKEDPVDAVIAGADDTLGSADDYTNLIARFQGTYAYSYVFDGQAGYLDHGLASASLNGQVTGAADWHINADEPDILDYDTSFKPAAQEALYEPNAYRSSDHDALVVGLDLLAFGFEGFQSPVAAPPAVNVANAGQTVPVKFSLSGDLGLDVLFGTPTSAPATCLTWTTTGSPAPTATSGGAGLAYDPATDTYAWAWKTDKAWGQTCRAFELTLDDGSYWTARFHFRK